MKALGVAAVVVTVVLWASAFVGIRAVGPHFSPGPLTLAAVSVIIQKPVLRKFPAAQATWFGILVGALCCLPFTGQLASEIQAAPLPATLGLVYLGVFPTAVAFTTWAYALSLIEAGKLAATTYLVPGTTILISWLLLNEIPTVWGLAGGVVCLVGVALTRRRSRPARQRGAAASQ